MIAPLSFLLLATPLVGADPPADLRGAWRLTAAEAEAAGVPLTDPRPTVEIQGDKVLYGGKEIATLTADPKADPRVIDLRFTGPDKTYEGIYRLDKGTLAICLNGQSEGVKERPSGFELTGRPAWRLLTFEKIKPEEVGPAAGFVGVVLMFAEKTREVVIQETIDRSPARAAGLRKGDILLAVGGTAVEDLPGAVNLVRKSKPGDEVILRVRRDGKEVDAKLKPNLISFSALVGLD